MALFAGAISSASTRSTLEVMLDAIRRKDEQQMDLPPALPSRPTSRGRLPSSRRSLLVSTALKSSGQETNLCLPERRVEVKEKGDRKGETFQCAGKSHAMRMFGLESYGERQEAEGPVDGKCTSYSLAINLADQFKSGGAIDYFSNKKLGVWCWLPEEKWECEKIHSASANNAHQVLMPRGKILMLPSEKILPANPVVQDNENDPALQCFVNEPSTLYCLEYRYFQDMIYVQLSDFIQQLENTDPHFIIRVSSNSKQLTGIYEEDSDIRQLRSFSLLEIVRLARSGYPTKMTHQQFVERYHFLLIKNTAAMDPLSASVAVPQKYSLLPGMYQVGHAKILFRSGQLATLERARACTLQGISYVQKYFRGARARCIFNDVKNGVTTLQTFIRAERARNEFHHLARLHRAAVLIQMHVKRWVAQKAYSKQQKLIMILQSVIRGWMARKHFNIGRNLEITKCNDLNLESDQSKKLHELEQDHSPLQDSDLSELKSRALKAEAELRHREEENSCLYEKLQQYEKRWSDYDAKMKHLEEMWQKQMTSLQMSLAVAQRSLASNDVANLAGRPDVSPNYPYFDSEDAMSVETYTTEGTPVKQSRAFGVRPNRSPEGLQNTISHLVKEFEERRQIFEDDAGFLVEVKAKLSVSNLNPHEELSKLKVQFASWKKNYKVRLREVKAALQKIGNSETGKKRRKWWGYCSSK